MRKIIIVALTLSTIPIQAQQKFIMSRSTSAQIEPTSNLCDYTQLSVERFEETGKPTKTYVNYHLRNCDGTDFAKNAIIVPDQSFITDTGGRTLKLDIFSPIRIAVSWKYLNVWEVSFEGIWKTLVGNQTKTNKQNQYDTSATATGTIANRSIPTGARASVKFYTHSDEIK